MKVAFVASGGGLKAYAYHLGVLRALEEHGFHRMVATEPRGPSDHELRISCYIGSSAGACTAAGCVYFDTLEEAEGVVGLNESKHPRFSRRVLFKPNLGFLWDRAGLCDARGVERYFRARATCNDFREMGPDLFICATQLNSSRKVVFGPKDSASKQNGSYDRFIAYYNDVSVSKAIAASVSVPGIFRPYRITNPRSGERFEYIDGEVRETLSVHIARDHDVDLVVVSNVWMPYHYDRDHGSVSRRGLGQILTQTMTQIIEQKVDRVRNEFDRYGLAIAAIHEFGTENGMPQQQIDALVSKVSGVLRYREMDEIYVAPDATDSRFNLAPSWSFKRSHLEYAREVGYDRAERAIVAWRDKQK